MVKSFNSYASSVVYNEKIEWSCRKDEWDANEEGKEYA